MLIVKLPSGMVLLCSLRSNGSQQIGSNCILAPLHCSAFYLQSAQNEEPTSRLELLSCSSYEFVAYVLARPGASGISLVQAVFGVPELILCPLRISPVAVKSFDQTRIADLLITGDNRGVARVCTGLASPGYLSRFLISAVPCVTPYCVRSGVRLVSKSLLYARLLAATSCWPFLSTSTPQLNQESSKASPEAVENFSLFPKLGRSGA